MEIQFKAKECLNNRALTILNERNDSVKPHIPDEIKCKALVEDCILDLEKHLNDKEPQNNIYFDLENINKSIDLKPAFLHKLLYSSQFSKTILDLLHKIYYDNGDFIVTSSILNCISKLLAFSDFQAFFIDNEIICNAMNLISHESSDIAKESLHIISELMVYVIKTDYPLPENFIYYVSSNININKIEQTEYSLKIFSTIAKYHSKKDILKEAISTIFNTFEEITENTTKKIISLRKEGKKRFNSDIDKEYNRSYDLIERHIVQTIYYIMKSDFSFYYNYKSFFKSLFYNVNGFSSTLTDELLVSFVFKILVLIIYNDENEATQMVSYIGYLGDIKKKKKEIDKINFDFSIYYCIMQNSEFIVLKPLTKIIIFNLFHLPPSFYQFCASKCFYKLAFSYLVKYGPFHVKSIILNFFRLIIQHPSSKEIIQYLINENFIIKASSFLEGDDLDSIADYLSIIDKMIEYAVISPCEKGFYGSNPKMIMDYILSSSEFIENIDRMLDQIPNEIKDLENNPNQESVQNEIKQKQYIYDLSQRIKSFCCPSEEEE